MTSHGWVVEEWCHIESARYLPHDTNLHFMLVGGGMTGDDIRRLIEACPLWSRAPGGVPS